jgi:hypothetical protein
VESAGLEFLERLHNVFGPDCHLGLACPPASDGRTSLKQSRWLRTG